MIKDTRITQLTSYYDFAQISTIIIQTEFYKYIQQFIRLLSTYKQYQSSETNPAYYLQNDVNPDTSKCSTVLPPCYISDYSNLLDSTVNCFSQTDTGPTTTADRLSV